MAPRRLLAITLSMLALAACWRAPAEERRAAPSASPPSTEPPSSNPIAPAPKTPPALPAPPPSAPPPSAGPWFTALGVPLTRTHVGKRFVFRQLDVVIWQASADSLAPVAAKAPPDDPACPPGMALVSGGFLLDARGRDDTDEVHLLQHQACAFWRTQDHGLNGLCDRFDRDRWQALSAPLPRRQMRFCVDRHEFPSIVGEYPVVVATFAESERLCQRAGKRLCTESEWTFACEGEEARPYPYGYDRDSTACNIDVFGPAPDDDTFKPRTTEHTARGLDVAFQGRRAGESPRCVSPFGVYDMTGNVDEWTRSVRPYGYKMIMKGGHWGPARQRCRPQTRGHGPHYVRYDQGFRCCADAGG